MGRKLTHRQKVLATVGGAALIFAAAVFSYVLLDLRGGVSADRGSIISSLTAQEEIDQAFSEPQGKNNTPLSEELSQTANSQSSDGLTTGSELSPSLAEVEKPFYQDLRYILLITDAIIVTLLLLTLIMRLTSKFFSQPALQQPVEVKPKETGPVTVDQLDVDIPV